MPQQSGKNGELSKLFFLNENSFAIHCRLMSMAHRPSAFDFLVLLELYAGMAHRLSLDIDALLLVPICDCTFST